ncbi:EndoU domain-containing protein [Amycolatopsis sp. H20-H5]|uniref:EndoU domain-containing protein n=1 Tax=Amycolatopsis sp. H20-H5 TaxID=3046309 RepID=UPI002DBC00C2|nr:EndoU domain-containing protein [Amycolatopsis sp. H20-H5]MEC3978165.1 EndoU domain-containing protein [Amycolatopsis sp. H20-H5]
MADEPDPYHGRNVYDHEASGRGAMPGRYGWGEESVVEGEAFDVTPEIMQRASYLSPYRMDHIAELHSDRASRRELGKSLFPKSWSDDKIFEAVQAVIVDPDSRWTREVDKSKGGGVPGTLVNPWHDREDIPWEIPARLKVDGYFDGVKLRVIVEPLGEGIISAYALQN